MSDDEIRDVIISGSGVMPPFGHLSDDEVESLVGYLKGCRIRNRGRG
jgi:cytochrome c5